MGACVSCEDEHGRPAVKAPDGAAALGLLWSNGRSATRSWHGLRRPARSTAGPTASIVRDPPLRRLPAGWRCPEPPVPAAHATDDRAHRDRLPGNRVRLGIETARHVGTVVHRELQRLRLERRIAVGPARRRGLQAHPPNSPSSACRRTPGGGLRSRRSIASHACRRTRPLGARRLATHSPTGVTGRCRAASSSSRRGRPHVRRPRTACAGSSTTRPARTKGGALEAFLDSEQARYRAQLERYADSCADSARSRCGSDSISRCNAPGGNGRRAVPRRYPRR